MKNLQQTFCIVYIIALCCFRLGYLQRNELPHLPDANVPVFQILNKHKDSENLGLKGHFRIFPPRPYVFWFLILLILTSK